MQITNPADRADFTQVEFAAPGRRSRRASRCWRSATPGTAATARPEEFANAQLSATNGIISQTATKYDVPGSDVAPLTDAIQHNAAVNHGNSGGPLFDLEGKQVGINTAIYFANGQRLEGENYAISVRRIAGAASRASRPATRRAGSARRSPSTATTRTTASRRHRDRLPRRRGAAGRGPGAAGHRHRRRQRPARSTPTRTTAP